MILGQQLAAEALDPSVQIIAPWRIEKFRKRFAGRTDMIAFCAEKNIHPDVEMIRMDEINHAFDRMEKSDVRYRFVIDMASLDAPAA